MSITDNNQEDIWCHRNWKKENVTNQGQYIFDYQNITVRLCQNILERRFLFLVLEYRIYKQGEEKLLPEIFASCRITSNNNRNKIKQQDI